MQYIKSFIQSFKHQVLDDLSSNNGGLVKKISSSSGSVIGGAIGTCGGSINMPLIGGIVGGMIGEEIGTSTGRSLAEDFVERYGVGTESRINQINQTIGKSNCTNSKTSTRRLSTVSEISNTSR